MPRIFMLCGLTGAMMLLNACKTSQVGEPTPPSAYEELPYSVLVLGELDPDIFAGPGIPGCRLADLPPFHWKEVDSGLVDIRTPEEYAIQTESLYQEGYRGYLLAREEDQDKYRSTPEISYEEFLATCNVFPEVDFEEYSVLGAQAMGTGCTVVFEKRVYRDDQSKTVRYEIAVVEEGTCETVSHNRNLILVSRIPPKYRVAFLMSG